MQIDNFSNFRLFNPTPIYSPESYASRQHFEQYFYSFYLKNREKFPEDIEYIPVFWHAYENCKAKDLVTPQGLQGLLSSLDHNKKYFTVCSHYSGIRYKLPRDTTVFSAATSPSDSFILSSGKLKVRSRWHKSSEELNIIKIPLLKNAYQETNKNMRGEEKSGKDIKKKDFFCNFIGAINTHVRRKDVVKEFENQKDILISTYHWRDTHDWDNIDYYPKVLENSHFTLCPRGFGRTSYRLYEAMQLGSIPVYLYDKPFLPYEDIMEWKDICVMIPMDRLQDASRLLRLKTETDIEEYKNNIQKVYNKYFTRAGVCDYILEAITNGS
tara:strand:- start:3023 stop:4000 length:978 start_codon:yes stop_codon:yes gene_type:complete